MGLKLLNTQKSTFKEKQGEESRQKKVAAKNIQFLEEMNGDEKMLPADVFRNIYCSFDACTKA